MINESNTKVSAKIDEIGCLVISGGGSNNFWARYEGKFWANEFDNLSSVLYWLRSEVLPKIDTEGYNQQKEWKHGCGVTFSLKEDGNLTCSGLLDGSPVARVVRPITMHVDAWLSITPSYEVNEIRNFIINAIGNPDSGWIWRPPYSK